MPATIRPADLHSPRDGARVLQLLDAYAADPMGQGEPLAAEVKSRLIPALAAFPTSLAFLALDEAEVPVGFATCFLGFSTFAALPLLNVSDFFVLPEHRGHGIGRSLLQAIEVEARARGCCRVTLEVQEKNERARRVYAALGYQQAVYTMEAGGSLYYLKSLVG
jgi:GNAT superfamily N-acetyltransferase